MHELKVYPCPVDHSNVLQGTRTKKRRHTWERSASIGTLVCSNEHEGLQTEKAIRCVFTLRGEAFNDFRSATEDDLL